MKCIIVRKSDKKNITSNSFDIADNLLSQIIGLMFNRNKNKSILFIFNEEKKHPIHSLFVFDSFFAIYLDKNKRIVEIFNVNPFEFYISNSKPAKYLIETYTLNVKLKVGEELKCLDGTL